MVLVANEKHMLTYEADRVNRVHVYFTANPMFMQEVWSGYNFQTKPLLKFFSESEIRRAKAKLAAEKRVSKKFVG